MDDEPAERAADGSGPPGLSARLRAAMAARGIPPEWLALIAGVPASAVVAWHRGDGAIDVDDFARLARAMSCRTPGPGSRDAGGRDV